MKLKLEFYIEEEECVWCGVCYNEVLGLIGWFCFEISEGFNCSVVVK